MQSHAKINLLYECNERYYHDDHYCTEVFLILMMELLSVD